MQDLYVISAVGKDQPGLVHSVAKILGAMQVNIVDMDARAVRGHFLMFLVVDLSTSKHSFAEMKVVCGVPNSVLVVLPAGSGAPTPEDGKTSVGSIRAIGCK